MKNILVSLRVANYVHKCNKCGKEVIAYRDCSKQNHVQCVEQIGNQLHMGQLNLIKTIDFQKAKDNNIQHSCKSDGDYLRAGV